MTISADVVTVRPFMTGRSQAIRLPKRFRLDAEEVEISREGDSIVLTPKKDQWAKLREIVADGGLSFGAKDVDERYDDTILFEYPRIGFEESSEHFEARVREYEKLRKMERREWERTHGGE